MKYFLSGEIYHIDADVIVVGGRPYLDIYASENCFAFFKWNIIRKGLQREALWMRQIWYKSIAMDYDIISYFICGNNSGGLLVLNQ